MGAIEVASGAIEVASGAHVVPEITVMGLEGASGLAMVVALDGVVMVLAV
jgi:hypothetical protein